jgi:UDP-glucose 4-epimerase
MNVKSERRILITGGAGFIGSHLAESLLADGHRVAVIDDLSTGRIENVAQLMGNPRFSLAVASITDRTLLGRLASRASVIYHLAAAVGVELIVRDPVRTIETNVICCEAVLQAALRHGVPVVITSSSEVYGKGGRVPFREDDDVVIGPTSRSRWSYAASKMVSEFLALAYHRQKGLPVTVARLFNTVGPRQTGRYGMVVPRFVRQALRDEPLTVYGDGRQSRCFLHVDDAVAALRALAGCRRAAGRVFNVGSREQVTILGLARRVLRAVEDQQCGTRRQTKPASPSRQPAVGRIVMVPYDRAYSQGFEDMARRRPDIARIRRLTGWRPRYDLDRILRDVIADLAAHPQRR